MRDEPEQDRKAASVSDSESADFGPDSARLPPLDLLTAPTARKSRPVERKSAKAGGKNPEPHYLDHRERLRKRFAAAPDSLPDYELLELVLFSIIPRRDVKPLAKNLLARFGDLPALLAAPSARIEEVSGAGPAVAAAIKAMHALMTRAAATQSRKRPVVSSWSQLLNYCRMRMAEEMREQFRVLFLDRKNQIIADEVQARGTVDHAPVYPREVVGRALELGASALILVHNHPSHTRNVPLDHAQYH